MVQRSTNANGTPKHDGFIRKTAPEHGYRKAAEFLLLIGKEQATRVLKHLSEKEIEGIAREISAIGTIEGKAAKRVLEEFGYLAESKNSTSHGGLQTAREMLEAVFDREYAEQIVSRVQKRTVAPPFSFLMDIDADQVVLLLKRESPPVLSVILPFLEPRLASQVLSSLPLNDQKELVGRISRLQQLDPEILQRAEQALRTLIREQGQIVTQQIDGPEVLVQILRQLPTAEKKTLLEELSRKDAALGRQLKDQLISEHIIHDISDRDLQTILSRCSDQEIAIVLKGVDDDTSARILTNVSSRRKQTIHFEGTTLGEIPKSEVQRAIHEFLKIVSSQVDDGFMVAHEST